MLFTLTSTRLEVAAWRVGPPNATKGRAMNDERVNNWNGRSGNAWLDMQPVLDRVFEGIEELLVETVPAGSPCRVLDVGCGTGATTLGVARRLGAGGRALGVDLSQPMTEAARARAERAGSLA